MFVYLRDRRQKTFEFLNRLCLLISNPLPPPLLNRHPSFFLIQRLDFYTNIGLTSSFTIHAYLFFTRILNFFTVLHFHQKYIWSNLLFYTCFATVSLFALPWTLRYHACYSSQKELNLEFTTVCHTHVHAHVH